MNRRGRAFISVASALALAIAAMDVGHNSAQSATGPNGLIAYSSWDDDLNYDIWTVDPGLPDQPPKRLTTDGQYISKKIDCGRDCAGTFVVGKAVRLTATPAAGFKFKKWTGACAGTQRACTVRLSDSKSVRAVFVRLP